MARTARLRASGYAVDAYLWMQTSCPSYEAVCSQNFRASPGDPAMVQSAAAFDHRWLDVRSYEGDVRVRATTGPSS